MPLADGPNHPRDVRARLERGELTAEEVLEAIVTATARALDRPEPVVIAHFLSILPKLGLAEADVPADLLDSLAAETARTGQRIEISERWRCPSAATLRAVPAPRRADPAEHGQPPPRDDRPLRPLPGGGPRAGRGAGAGRLTTA